MKLDVSTKVLIISILALVVCLFLTFSGFNSYAVGTIGGFSILVIIGTSIFKGRHLIIKGVSASGREISHSVKDFELSQKERREYDKMRNERSREIYLDELAKQKAIRDQERTEAEHRKAKKEHENYIKWFEKKVR